MMKDEPDRDVVNPLPCFYGLTEHYLDDYYAIFGFEKMLHSEQTEFCQIDVVETKSLGRALIIDGALNFAEAMEFIYHEAMTHVPLGANRNARRVLIVGGGDCGVLREVVRYPAVERIVHVEIDRRVIAVCQEFFPAMTESLKDPRVDLHFTDGYDWVAETDERFDAIIVDSTDPFGPAKKLISPHFYTFCSRVMNRGALLIHQLASPFFYPDLFEQAFSALATAFAYVRPVLVPIPLYVSGSWGLGLAANDADSWCGEIDPPPVEGLRYFTKDIYRALLTLPVYAREQFAAALELAERPSGAPDIQDLLV